MAEFKINRFRYNWRGNWQASTNYNRDDVVIRTGNVYYCISQHTSTATFATDQPTRWAVMSESNAYRGTWSNAVVYAVNDIVTHGGQIYRCVSSHTSQALFSTSIANWQLYLASTRFIGEWATGTLYKVGEAVSLSGVVYVANTEHTAAGTLESTQSNWDIYFSNIEYRGNFTSNLRYNLNDLVKFGGSIWRCNESHQSGDDSTLDFNQDYWDIEIPGQNFAGVWNVDTGYGTGDIVRFGGRVYVASQPNQGLTPSVETLDWTLLAKGFDYAGDWTSVNDYTIGQVVRHGGVLYAANTATVGIDLEIETLVVTVTAGQSGAEGNRYAIDAVQYGPTLQFYTGITYQFDQTNLTNVYWPNPNITGAVNQHPLHFSADNPNGDSHSATGTAYTRNVVYQLDGRTVSRAIYNRDFSISKSRVVSITVDRGTPAVLYYYCQNHLGMGGSITVNQATAGIDPALSADWTVLVDGVKYRNGYIDNTSYTVGDLVSYNNKIYKCIVAHVSDAEETFPDNGSGTVYWAVYLEGEPDNALERVGDLLTFGITPDTSTLGAIPVHIGTADQVLVVQSGSLLNYNTLGAVANVLYVSNDGIDSVDRGTTPDKPYASIKFACIQAEKLTGQKTISVATGLYNEIGPISVPANTVILGDELRSVTINVDSSLAEYSNDVVKMQNALLRLLDIIPLIVLNTVIVPTAGNTQPQIRYLQPGSSTTATAIQDRVNEIAQYIAFHVQSGGTEPVIYGTNTRVTTAAVHQTLAVIAANKQFIQSEIAAYVAATNPGYVFDAERYRRDFGLIVDALLYDTEYTGNSRSQRAARWYRNSVVNATDDLFYFRNNTGLRNCTLKGMTGTINPPGVFELYQLPTGKAYCSLDPGWGPNDESVWITTRSPYIQGVTNIGSNCIGQKIDGALHNGGNKSMVSNDFTQVLSDGIGTWVLNNGRSELVSVFTYYNQIGYFAQHGGKIRSLNGNCSYGTFGAYSSGRDATEVPGTAQVFTKTTEAIIANTFAGDFGSNIQLIEFLNAGIDYSSGTFSFVGSGIGAAAEGNEIRDRAVYQARVAAAGDSTNPGGSGYISVRSSAQLGGGASTIKLSATDSKTISDYLGVRIIITSGVGVGQYGYITAYNASTKIVTVARESDDQPGWDHVIEGYPLVESFESNTNYSIEPRPIFTTPTYTVSQGTMYADSAWHSATFGPTVTTYTVTAPVGSGSSPTAATFIVTKNGKKYSVSLATAGTGYVVDDEVTILGTSLGGFSSENDLVIRVDTINGAGSIVNFNSEGVGCNGLYVVTTSDSNKTSFSKNATAWSNGGNLPSSGSWKVTAGQNKFVAVKLNSSEAAYSTDCVTWTISSLNLSRNWSSVIYGNGRFVAVATNLNAAAYSLDGITWTTSSLPTAGDSTISQWTDIAYGGGKFVAIANTNNITASSTDGITWEIHTHNINDSSQLDWVSVAYGNNRFVALSSQGVASYSFDGSEWYASTLPTQDGSTVMNWKSISYGQGVFLAVCDTGGANIGGDANAGETNFVASSEGGVSWTGRELLSSRIWSDTVFGNNNQPLWVIVAPNTSMMNAVQLGARTRGRVTVNAFASVQQIRLWEPGSAYNSAPTLTIVDPTNISDAYVINRIGSGVLANPSFSNRGVGYLSASTVTTVSGDGYADTVPIGTTITLTNITVIPGTGAQLVFDGYPADIYSVSTITPISQVLGNNTVTFTITPSIPDFDSFYDGQDVLIYERYSQIRITGHDFLDVGTGNFEETNYPQVDPLQAQPFNEVVETNGGRVFYTSTDQDGNFRAGDLFSVQQATGTVTVNAQFFDFGGLTELTLGGVSIGGSGVVIREFSTDPTFEANSNNIVPTQRATKSYLASRLSAGGDELELPGVQAGFVLIEGSQISNIAGQTIQVNAKVDFAGPKANISGRMLAESFFHRSFNVE